MNVYVAPDASSGVARSAMTGASDFSGAIRLEERWTMLHPMPLKLGAMLLGAGEASAPTQELMWRTHE